MECPRCKRMDSMRCHALRETQTPFQSSNTLYRVVYAIYNCDSYSCTSVNKICHYLKNLEGEDWEKVAIRNVPDEVRAHFEQRLQINLEPALQN